VKRRGKLERKVDPKPTNVKSSTCCGLPEATFRWAITKTHGGQEKLSEGIRLTLLGDQRKLEVHLASML